MQWSKEQLQAINERNKNILVAAAAGSGKTAVLVERIKQLLIKDGIGIDKMLIVTFTNAAAGEMRERIANAITEELNNCHEQKHEPFLTQQLNLIHRASISTFHSFCIEILRKYFYLIDIEPNFKICDDAQKNILQSEALEELVEIQFEKQEPLFIRFADCFASDRDDTEIKTMVLQTFNFIQSMPDPLKWIEEKVEILDMDKEAFVNGEIYARLKNEILDEVRKAERLLTKAKVLSNKEKGPYYYVPIIEDDLIQLNQYKTMVEECLKGHPVNFLRLPSKKDDFVDIHIKEAVKSLRAEAKKVLSDVSEIIENKGVEQQVKELNHIYPLGKCLFQLVKQFDKLYSEKKNEKGLLDFNDLEHLGLTILSDEEVAREYQKKYEYIFIDEYQDSNMVQETLINRIKRKNNLFMVGDVKQSIYRFRLADPGIFLRKYNEYKALKCDDDIKIDLNRNYRSKDQVINGINYLFKHLMKEATCEIEYDEDAFLYKGLAYKAQYDLPTKVMLLQHNTSKNAEIDDEIKDMLKAEVEALSAANQIKKSLGATIFDCKKQKERQLGYKDMVILLRTVKDWMTIYYETLLKENIPVYMDAGEGYFETVEVGIFLNLIAIIDNKKQDIPLLSVLRSPIGDFTTQEMVNIRLEFKDMPYHQALHLYAINGQDGFLKEKCDTFIEKINVWKEKATYMPIDEFLWKLLKKTGFYTYISALPGGEKRQGNLLILMEKAKQFQNTTMKGLFEFLKFMEQAKKTSANMNTAKVINEYDDVVRIMSIHKSKGLEFPFVIVGGLGKMFNKRSYSSNIVFHKDIGIGLKHVNPDLEVYTWVILQKLIKKQYEKELLSEEMRILYVALTRAQDQLILLGTLSDIKKSIGKWQLKDEAFIHDAQCYMDWIMPVLLKHPHCKERVVSFLEENLISQKAIQGETSSWDVHIHDQQYIYQRNQEKSEYIEGIKEHFVNGFDHSSKKSDDGVGHKLDWSYQYSTASHLPSKMTVTEIRRLFESKVGYEERDIPNLTTHPSFISSKQLYSALERGTFMHIVMQHIDPVKTDSLESIEDQIKQIVGQEIMRQEEGDTVDPYKIFKFFQTDIGKRMKCSENVYREVPFNLVKNIKEVMPDIPNIDEVLMIQGTIDCYFKEENHYILVDYKNDYFPKGSINETRLNNTVAKYKIQLELYKQALENIKHINVKEVYLYLFSIEKAIKVL